MRPPAAIAFDLDGTLVDTVPARIRAWLQALHEAGISVGHREVAMLIGSDGRYVARESARALGQDLDEQRAERIDRRQGEVFETLNVDPKPLPASRELLMRLEARSIPWAIATSSRHEQVGASVQALRLPRPPTIIDGHDVAHAKAGSRSAPEGLSGSRGRAETMLVCRRLTLGYDRGKGGKHGRCGRDRGLGGPSR